MIIEDGQGTGTTAAVTGDGQVNTLATTQTRMAYVTIHDRMGYSWYSSYACASGDIVLYIKNTDPDRELAINRIVAGGVGGNIWKVNKVTAVGTVSGAVITPVNTVFGSGKTPYTTSYGNLAVAGISSVVVIAAYHTVSGASSELDSMGSLILRANDSIAIQSSTSGLVSVFITGYYKKNET